MVAMNAPLDTLTQHFKRHQIIAERVERMTYDSDASLERGMPDGVLLVENSEQVRQAVQWARRYGVPLVARGAGTGLSGGAVARRGGLIIEFARMNRVLELDLVGRSAVVEPGVVNLVLDELVKSQGLYFPPDPASGRTATLGGNIAENAGGPHCFKYGVMTNYLTGLQVVFADGRQVQLGGRALDYPEYDFVGLITGSEGTLALITQASVRLLRNPPAVKTMMASFDSVEQAGQAVSAVIARGFVPATMEMMDQKMMRIIEDYAHAGLPIEAGAALIIEVDGYPESVSPQMEEVAAILRAHAAQNLRLAQTPQERELIWYGRKSAAGAVARLAPAYYLLDGTVPRSKLAATLAAINRLCEARALRVGYVFHAGDGNLHPFILIPDPQDTDLMHRIHTVGHQIMQLCVEMGGSITGEHGVGSEKNEFMPLMYTSAELTAMHDIKQVFDLQNILNPGKIFPAVMPALEAPPVAAEAPPSPFAPDDAEQAAQAIGAWRAQGKRIFITSDGATRDDGVILSTKNLRGIVTTALEDLYVTVQAGTRLADLQAELAPHQMWVPLVSPYPEATIGGLIATNLNAPLRMRYGGIRDLLLAAHVVLPDGRVIWAGRPVVKNVAGYDLPKLFVGSYGTLGLIVDATLKLMPLPRARATLLAPLDNIERGLTVGMGLVRHSLVASGILLCSQDAVPDLAARYALIYTAEGTSEDVTAELVQVRGVLQKEGVHPLHQLDTPSANDVWASFVGHASDALVLRAGVAPKDVVTLVKGMIAHRGAFVADLANGMVYTRDIPLQVVRPLALEMGGYAIALSGAVHDRWGYQPASAEWMRALKARWDPQGLFNPDAFIV
jgi:D-lactate dehydrogenase (cytochrome)